MKNMYTYMYRNDGVNVIIYFGLFASDCSRCSCSSRSGCFRAVWPRSCRARDFFERNVRSQKEHEKIVVGGDLKT